MAGEIRFHPVARSDLFELYDYIEAHSGSVRAGSYIDRIEALCNSLAQFPDRGVLRDDLGLGVRTIGLERRTLIAYRLKPNCVEILRILYAGRDTTTDDFPS